MRHEEVTDLARLLEWCLTYKDSIYVREEIDGKWSNVTLGALPPKLQADWIAKWLERGHVPHRMMTDEEIAAG